MIDPERELFKWGPIDGRILYIDAFMEQMVAFKKMFPYSWPDVLCYFKDRKVVIIVDYNTLYGVGERVFRKEVLPAKRCASLFKQWTNLTTQIDHYTHIYRPTFLASLSDAQLAEHY